MIKSFTSQIFHCSYEMNLSVQQSGFTVYRKRKPTTDDDKKVKVSNFGFPLLL